MSRRNSTDSSIISDMKDIVSGLGGTDGSPGSISPGELSEMKAVLDADKAKVETHFHIIVGRPLVLRLLRALSCKCVFTNSH